MVTHDQAHHEMGPLLCISEASTHGPGERKMQSSERIQEPFKLVIYKQRKHIKQMMIIILFSFYKSLYMYVPVYPGGVLLI